MQAEMQKYWDKMGKLSESLQKFAVIGKSIKADEHAKYLRSLKTTLFFLKKNTFPLN